MRRGLGRLRPRRTWQQRAPTPRAGPPDSVAMLAAGASEEQWGAFALAFKTQDPRDQSSLLPPAPKRTRNSSVFPKATKGGRGNPSLAELTRRRKLKADMRCCADLGALREPPNRPAPPEAAVRLYPRYTFMRPHAQEGGGYPNSSQKPLTSEIPPVRFAERRYLVISAGQVRLPPGQVQEVARAGNPRSALKSCRRTPHPSTLGAPALFQSPSVSHSPTKLLGDHIAKPWSCRLSVFSKPLHWSVIMGGLEGWLPCPLQRKINRYPIKLQCPASPSPPGAHSPSAPIPVTSAHQFTPGVQGRLLVPRKANHQSDMRRNGAPDSLLSGF